MVQGYHVTSQDNNSRFESPGCIFVWSLLFSQGLCGFSPGALAWEQENTFKLPEA